MIETLKNIFENNHIRILKSNHDYVVIDKHNGYTIAELLHNEDELANSLTMDEIRAVVYQIFTEHGSYECNIRPKKNGNCNCGSKDCRKIIMQAFEKAINKEGGK